MQNIILLLFILSAPLGLIGQQILLFDTDTAFLELDDADLFSEPYFQVGIQVTNNSDSTITLDWSRMNHDCHQLWGIVVADLNITYPPGDSDSNVLPVVMDPQVTFELNVGIAHNQQGGCCNIDIEFTDEAGNPVDTCYFVFRINSDCSATTSTSNISLKQATRIFPNPVNDILSVISEEMPEQLFVVDQLARIKCQAAGRSYIDVGELSSGIYYMVLKYADGTRSVHTFFKE